MKITTISTGTIETYLHVLSRPLVKEEGIRISVPVSCYLIEYKNKKILFDAGQTLVDYEQNPNALFFIKIAPQETAIARLNELNITSNDIDYVIISHSHGDHFLGLKDFPNSTVIVQRSEAKQLKEFKNKFIILDGQYDLFNDGNIVCIPTSGHTPGHQSLLLNNNGKQILLIGDAIYFPEALDYTPSTKEYLECKEFFDSLKLISTLQKNGVELCFGHYPYKFI